MAAGVCAGSLVLHAEAAFAALTITKNTWNVIGLDSNDVATGPNIFPVAAVVCNTGPSAATNLTTTFVWDSSNGLINLTGPATVNRGTLAAGSCLPAYYWVAVTRTASAYATTRRYHINATADGGLTASTPSRELFVERLISQNRNTSQTPSGPTTVVVGQTYTYSWTGATATQGYEQIENFVAFNDSIFRVLSIQSTYSAGASPIPGTYNDACGWNDDPASGGYRTCAGSGKAGGNVTMSITVQIIGTGSASLAGAIYDFSGSSYHYNADFGRNALQVTAIAGSADVSVTKTNGVSGVSTGSTTTYSIVVRNAGPSAADGATVTDPAVGGLDKTAISCSAAGGAVCPAAVTVAGLERGLIVPTLPSGGSVTFTVTALVTAATGSVANTATVAPPAGLTDPNPANNTATDTDPIAVGSQADLAVTKSNGVTSLSPGATTIYTVVVSNYGPNAVTGATVTDAAPPGVTFGAWTCAGSGGAVCPATGSGNVNATVTLPSGTSVTFRINATIGSTASGSITNTATVAPPAGTTDSNPANNSASDTDPLTTTTNRADLSITKTNGVATVAPGAATVYTVVVRNNGPDAVAGATVTDAAPDGLTVETWTCSGAGGAVCRASGSGNLNALVTLPAGGTATFEIRATVSPGARGAITNIATVTLPAGLADSDPANNTATDTDTIPAASAPAPPPPPAEAEAEPAAASLSVTKTASAGIVELGDAITYSILIRNATGTLPATSVEDRLPLGFAYVAGTAHLAAGAVTVRLADPAGANTRMLVFAIPAQPGLSEVTLTYQVRPSAGALQGDGRNCARAVAADGTPSNQMCVRVIVSSGVFTQQACVIGKVFVDASGDRVQSPQEPGVPGVALYLEDGTSILTDGAGGFSYCGVRAGTHVLKIDRSTLPARARLVAANNRHGLTGSSAFLDVKFGEVHRADFVIEGGDAGLLAEVERRRMLSRDGALNPETAPSVPGAPPAADPAATQPAGREASHQTTTARTGAQPPLLAVGVVEGIVSLTSLRRSAALTTRPADVFDEELRRFSRSFNDGKGVAAGRAAVFARGTIKRDYRLSLSFDSERPDRGALFRDIQPDAFYPIYGDASQKRFDAQTSKRYYAKVERGRGYVLFGDFVTPRESAARDLGMYARTLTGVQHRFERRNVSFNVFATRDTLRQVIDEFGGRGISGPYSVSNPNGVSGTEKVEIVTRDRNQPALVLRVEPLTRFLDYEFEPFSGRVLFRRPVPSMDEDLNPVSIRITYEVDSGGDRHWVDGFDGRVAITRRVEVGGAWAQDKNPFAPYQLASANATVSVGRHTTVTAEAARSVATVNTNAFNQLFTQNLADVSGEADGTAARVELVHEADRLRARVYAGTSDAAFHNPSATLNGGRSEAGARASYQLRPQSRLRGELVRSSDRVTGGRRHGGMMAFESKFRRLTFEVGLRHVKESAEPAQASSAGLLQPFGTTALPGFGFNPIGDAIDPGTGLPLYRPGSAPLLSAGRFAPLGDPLEATTIRAKVSSALGKAWTGYVEGEQDVTGADKRMAALGAEYRAAERARLYVRHELISSLDGIYALREGQRTQRTVFGVASAYRSAGELFSEYRMNDAISGREAQAALGLRNVWKVGDGVRLSTGLERLNPILSAGQAATAATFGAEFTRSAQLKGTSRLEWRREGSTNNWLSTAGFARRVSQDWTMLAKNYYQLTSPAGTRNQLQDRFWVGAAYRDSERNRQNLLSRYQFTFERLPSAAQTAAIGQRRVHVVSTHGDYRRAQPWMVSGQYAGKWVREELETAGLRYAAHLVSGRAGYDVTSRIDVGGLASVMWSGSDERLRKALGAEVGVLLVENTWLSVGYNVTGFSDRDFDNVLGVDATTRGFFLRLRMKFEENLFGGGIDGRR